MKKLVLILPIIMCGCANHSKMFDPAPSKTIINSKCEDIQSYRVIQVLDKGALALACDSEYGCAGMVVFVPNGKDEMLYDDKIIKPEFEKCIAYSGVYKYENRQEMLKTVPKLKFIDSEVSNPEYDRWLKEQDRSK